MVPLKLPAFGRKVQQGDPLSPLLFLLVLNIVVSEITSNEVYADLFYDAGCLDDGVLVGHRSMVFRALTIIQELGPSLSLIINIPKCKIFSCSDVSSFPQDFDPCKCI